MVRYEILIKLNDEMLSLDTYDVDPIQLNFNIADIKDISSRNSSYSKTIKIPETGHNRQIFNDIGDLNNEGDFNPNLKTEAWVLVDSIVVFKGFLQLRNVITDLETGKRDYEIVIYAQNDNFFKEIGDSMLTDLDYSELNHIWNETNIVNSWTATTDNQGYYYPLIDYGYNWNLGAINGFQGNQVRVNKMYPATNVKYLWDKIFANAGYTYESEFIDSDVFKNLYIPFNQQNFTRADIEDTTQYFSVGMTGNTTIDTGIVNPPLVQLQNPVFLGVYRIPFSNENSPYGDPDNLYDITLFEYEAPSGFVSQRFVCDFNLTFRHGLQLIGIGAGNTVCTIRFKRSKDEDGNDIPPTVNNPTGGRIVPVNGSITTIPLNSSNFDLSFGSNINNDPVTVTGQISTDILDNTPSADGRFLKLYPTEKLWVEVTAIGDNSQIRTDVGVPSGPIILTNYDIFTANTQNVLFNVLEEVIVPEELYPYISAIPKKFKQKDFITSIIKMFNLYVEPSKEFDKTLIIEPRDQFYQGGEVKDWTKKLDTTQPLNIQILGDTQNNEIKLTYKKDSDFYNEDYFNIRTDNEVYGEFSKFLENDFISGTRKVEPEFAATPLVKLDLSTSIVIPQIYKVDNATVKRSESKPRILTRFYSSTKEPWGYDDFIFYSDSGQPNNAKTMLSTSGFTDVPHNFIVGDVVTITQSDGGVAQPWLTGTFEIVEIPDIYSIVLDLFFVAPGGPAISGTATPTDGLVNGDNWVFEGDTYSLYPYLGHFSHPLRPSYDINFGQTDGLYYETNVVTNNNLYEVYWKNAVEELMDKSSRIITGNFYLNAQDIADFKFSDTIFIDGQYYKVNKITYDPTKTITSNVELIKTNYVTVPIQQSITILPEGPIRNPNGTPVLNPAPPIRLPIKPGNISTSSTNNVQGIDNIVTGNNNNVFGQDNYVSGKDNTVSSKNNIVTGSGNTIDSISDRNLIVGAGNKVSSGYTRNVIFGDNVEIERDDLFITRTASIISSKGNIKIEEDNLDSSIISAVDSNIKGKSNNIISSSGSSINNSGSTIDNFNNIIGSVNSNVSRAIGTSVIASNLSDIDLNDFNPQLQSHNTFILGSYGSNIDLSIASNNGGDFNSSFIIGCDFSDIIISQDGGAGYIITDNQIIGSSSCDLDIKTTIIPSSQSIHNSIFNSAVCEIIQTDASVCYLNSISNSFGSDINVTGTAPWFNSIISSLNSDIIGSNLLTSVVTSNESTIIDSQYSNISFGFNTIINDSIQSNIFGGGGNQILSSNESVTLGGIDNIIDNSNNSIIIGGLSNTISGATNTILIGCDTITASQDDTVYVPNLVIVDSFTPTGSGDTAGEQGQITWDDDYIYVKTSVGWKRSTLSTF